MDPISIAVELELGSLIIGAVGIFATWLHNGQQKAHLAQKERHHRELRAARMAAKPAPRELPEVYCGAQEPH